jgi:hypothetical protein
LQGIAEFGAEAYLLATKPNFVMAGLVPAIHVLRDIRKDVDARHKAGHDSR